ncbi:MAG TPA: UvrD-helicase domain-containing protein, partial [Candidatus Bathyarchaeia archaeon]|nr:UvrD-helicase domain-containing protein [Candidatus Bathyarchaeia archaeon]
MIDLDSLNPPQREAVLFGDGPLLVLAGAGSGKTRVLTHRVAHLIDRGHASPEDILAVTFTNKAAREMRERLERLLGGDTQGLTVGTFHSTCARWLRREAPRIGLAPGFAIYDDADQLAVCRRALGDLDLGEDILTPQALRAYLDRRKNTGESIAAAGGGDGARDEALTRAALRYEELLRRAGAVDFGDLIVRMVELLERDPGRRETYQRRYRYVLVDEYQD